VQGYFFSNRIFLYQVLIETGIRFSGGVPIKHIHEFIQSSASLTWPELSPRLDTFNGSIHRHFDLALNIPNLLRDNHPDFLLHQNA
jgi:hypothetical protein